MCREQRVLAGLLGEPACGVGHSGRVGEGAGGVVSEEGVT